MRKLLFLSVCFLLTGCLSQRTDQTVDWPQQSTKCRLIVKDGNCEPLENVEVYHLEKDVLLFQPWGPLYTDKKGMIDLSCNACDVMIRKEGYKPAHVVDLSGEITTVFLYSELEEPLSGITDFNNCQVQP